MNKQSAIAQLQAKKAEVQTRMDKVSKDLGKQYSQDFAEQATERENDEVLMSIRQEAESELQQIKHALRRVDSGEYGSCDKCGKTIDPRRLDIMPYATRCAPCAE